MYINKYIYQRLKTYIYSVYTLTDTRQAACVILLQNYLYLDICRFVIIQIDLLFRVSASWKKMEELEFSISFVSEKIWLKFGKYLKKF